jgi:hypothetical protein
MLRGHDSRAERSPERAGRGGVKTLPMKIPGAEREALLEIFCPRQDLCRERERPPGHTPVTGQEPSGASTAGRACDGGRQQSMVATGALSPAIEKNHRKRINPVTQI